MYYVIGRSSAKRYYLCIREKLNVPSKRGFSRTHNKFIDGTIVSYDNLNKFVSRREAIRVLKSIIPNIKKYNFTKDEIRGANANVSVFIEK